MNRYIARWGTSVAIAVLTVAAIAPAAAVGGSQAPVAPEVDLADALASDGRFRGRPDLSGTVNAADWRLTSDLGTGEAPRFAPARGQTQTGATTQAVSGSWSALGSNGAGDGPIQTTSGSVRAMAISGTNLYVGGLITNVGGIAEADFIARWDGSAWHALGGSGGTGALNGHVEDIAISGTNVYVGGSFTDVVGISTADFVAMWNGSFWSGLGSNFAGDGALNNSVTALAVLGSSLYVSGWFTDAATIAVADRLAVWTGSSWTQFSSNAADHPDTAVSTLVLHGGALYAGGFFQNIGGVAAADGIARWNWNNWEAVGNGLGGGAETIAFSSSGTMYVGGSIWDAGGQATADMVVRLDGSSWVALGSNGAGDGAIGSTVWSVVISGNNVFVGGQFSNAAGIAEADRLAVFDGTNWSALGSNGSGDGALNGIVRALAVSSSLIVGGEFTNAGGVAAADRVAAFGPLTSYKPDGRIRKGTGAFVGNNIYNATGINQTRTGATTPGHVITFGISGQNDSGVADRIRFAASGTVVTGYTIKYFNGSTDITSAVNAGTYQSPLLAAGGAFLITAKVTVKATAATGSSVTRLVTLRSVSDSAKLDVVKFVGKRS